jgi:3-methyladenine DNA glycosylase Tag
MVSFAGIEARAAARKGGPKPLEKLLPKARSRAALANTPDDVFLSTMAKQIFRSGFVWKIVDYKWAAMEEAFAGFDPEIVAALGDREIDEMLLDPRVIRHRAKIESVRANAAWVLRTAKTHGGFGAWIAAWPLEDILGLWDALAEEGSRLGGWSGAVFLREVGKDTFLLTPDVLKALRRAKVLKGEPTTKEKRAAIQQAFNAWRKETRRPLCQLSRILAYSVG